MNPHFSPRPADDESARFCPHCLSSAAALRPQHPLMLEMLARMQAQQINLEQLLAAAAAHLDGGDGAPRKTRNLLTRMINSPSLDLSPHSGKKALCKRLSLLEALAKVLGMEAAAVQAAYQALLARLQPPLSTAAQRLALQKAKAAEPRRYYLRKDVTLIKAWGFEGQHHARRFYTGFEISLPAGFAALDEAARLAAAKRLVAQKYASFTGGPDRDRAFLHGYYLCNQYDEEEGYIPCPRPRL